MKGIQLQVAASVLNEGNVLARAVGNKSFEDANARSEMNVRTHYEKAERSLEAVLEQATESIRIEIESELKKDLPQTFVARLTPNHKAEDYTFKNGKSAENPQIVSERTGKSS